MKLAPKRWTAYPALVDAYTGLGDPKATRRALDRLLALRSGPVTQAVAARAYWDRGWREDAGAAIADATAGATTPSQQAAFLQQGGQLAWERGDVQESLDHYRAAVNTDPDEHGALAGQGRALAALGRTSEALRAYQTALAKRPAPRYALELGELYEKLGLPGAARVQYDLVRELVRRDAAGGVDDELVIGFLEADHGDPQEAVRRLRAEWDRQPGIAVADALGWALHRAGDDAQALTFATRTMDKEHGGEVRSALYAYHRGRSSEVWGRRVRPAGISRRRCGSTRPSRRCWCPRRSRRWRRWANRRPRACRSRRTTKRSPGRPGSPGRVRGRPVRRERRLRSPRRVRRRRVPPSRRPLRGHPRLPRRARRPCAEHPCRRGVAGAGHVSGPVDAAPPPDPRGSTCPGGPPAGGPPSAGQRLPRFSCSRSIASKRALKLPLPKPIEPCRSIISKKTVGRSWTGLVKICSR